jgi:hypothetical protein
MIRPATKRRNKRRKCKPEFEFPAPPLAPGERVKRGPISYYREQYCGLLVEHCRNGGFIEGFADKIDVHVDTLYEWGKKHSEFKTALACAKQGNRVKLLQIAMAGMMGRISNYNASTCIFLLKAVHGFREDGPDALLDKELDFDFGDESVIGEPENVA